MTNIIEKWLPINDTNGQYEISNHGRLKRLPIYKGKGFPKKERIIYPNIDSVGYYRFGVMVCGKLKTIKAHQLVARYFIPNPEGKNTVNHLDGNKKNNHISNLEWATYAENNKHAYLTGLKNNKGLGNGRCKLSDDQVIDIFLSKGRQVDIATKYGVGQTMVSAIKTKKNWTHITDNI